MCFVLHARVRQADAEERQPQRLASREWAAQDHPLLHSTRGVRQPQDPLVHLALRVADEVGGSAAVFPLTKGFCWVAGRVRVWSHVSKEDVQGKKNVHGRIRVHMRDT